MTTRYQTDIRDPSLARSALAAAGADFADPNQLRATMNGVELTFDFTAGVIHTTAEAGDVVAQLRQLYAEAQFMGELTRQRGEVLAREVRPNGDIVLTCSTVFEDGDAKRCR